MYPFPELLTPRTRIGLATLEEAQMLQRYRVDNRTHLAPWEPERTPGYYTLEACEHSIADSRDAALTDRAYPLLVFDPSRSRVLASFTFSNVMRGVFQAAHLGYGIDHAHENQGLMFEALEAGMGFAFGSLELHRVMANYMPHNRRSERLLGRLGFEREGYARSYLRIAGVWRDHVLTARIHPGHAAA
jgi:ribosomal-protein-alanine N-acetyltransferase